MRRKRPVKLDPKMRVEQATPPRAVPEPVVYPPGSVHEKRQKLAEKAAKLQAQIRTCPHCTSLREQIAATIEESESLLIKAVEETEASEGRPITRKITNKELADAGGEVLPTQPVVYRRSVGKGKRKCSLCHEPGHQARHCPNAHIIQKQKKAKAAVKEERAARESALKPGQRACSICRRPGHRAKNCPERES